MTRVTPRRPGGRTARNTAAVLDATLAELGESGYAGLTVERVAARSGVHKATIYRRWGGADGLLAAALEQADHDSWTPPDTGALESDLRALGEEVAAGFSAAAEEGEEGNVATATIAAAFQSPAAAEALRAFMEERLRRCAEVVARAERRGEVPEGTDAAEVVRAAVAPVYFRLFISREEGAAEAAARAAQVAAGAAKAGTFRAGPSDR
ncbi:TetR/AcrR family transcriptional regulator [Nocardiopsis chromatogenes]|uniref:TetR/AcrR family transcriptional regulator n=1 Tax=Nocardiopsis chromatogenes TaxID=280239 RepID=UPI000348D9E0|nr:TetR/AcrR family transcriptional regulator [Nocardiopsis chromatogenes]